MATIIQIQEALDRLTGILRDVQILIPRLRDEIKSAFVELNKLKTHLTDTKHTQKLNEAGCEWEFQCLQSAYMIQDVADTSLVKSLLQRRKGLSKMQPFLTLTSVMSQYHLANKIKKITPCISALINLASNAGDNVTSLGNARTPAASVSANTSSSKRWQKRAVNKLNKDDEAFDVVGFVEEAESLCTRLLKNSEGLDVIPIVGPPGSGKTTLAKMIYNQLEVKKHFQWHAWVQQIPKKYFRHDLSPSLWDEMRGKHPIWLHLPVSDLFYSKPECPFKWEEFLVVIEDVNEIHVWDKIRFSLPEICGKDCKILITTCSIGVALHVSRNPIQLCRLSYKDSWKLFLREACITEEDFNNSDLSKTVNLKERILIQCEGSPRAIVILGGILSTKQLSYLQWSRVIDEHAETIVNQELAHDESVNSKIIDLCFDDLPNNLKQCFMYMSIFPRAFDIPVRRLVRLWTAEGLINDDKLSIDQTPEDVAEEYFKTLVDRNMIEITQRGLKGRAKKCRMIGIVYDFILAKSMDLGYVYVHHNYNTVSSSATTKSPRFNVRRLAQYSDIMSYPSSDSFIQYIRSYISFNNRRRDSPTTEVGMLLNKTTAKRGFGLLRVIDLEGVYKPMLPDTISKLLHLRYLGLRLTFLDSLPMSVGDLPALETLDIKHTSISNLPSSIWKAKNLRHLYMNEVHHDLSIELRFGESLTNLQTLLGLVIGARSPMADGLKFLITLRKLGLTCHPESIQVVVQSISHMENLQSLRLRSVDEHGLPSNLALGNLRRHFKLTDLYLLGAITKPFDVEELPQNLEILTLSLSELKEDPMPILGRLPRLKILKLCGQSYQGKHMICFRDTFPSLYELKLWKLENLEKWFVVPGAMPAHRQLEIRCCSKLNIVRGLHRLTALKELTLTNMPEDLVGDLKASLEGRVFIKENKWLFSDLCQDGVTQ